MTPIRIHILSGITEITNSDGSPLSNQLTDMDSLPTYSNSNGPINPPHKKKKLPPSASTVRSGYTHRGILIQALELRVCPGIAQSPIGFNTYPNSMNHILNITVNLPVLPTPSSNFHSLKQNQIYYQIRQQSPTYHFSSNLLHSFEGAPNFEHLLASR